MLRHLDLFSGIGGFALAASWTGGIETIAFCEIDPFCQKVLKKHWPEVPCFDDVRTLRGEGLGRVDLITGGFPCQDISVANKEATGLEGARSGLWFELLRIVREARPAWCVIENVPRLASLGLDTVLEGLEESRYQAWPLILGAHDVGAWHKRQRFFIVCADSDRLGMLAGGGTPIALQSLCLDGDGHGALEEQAGVNVVRGACADPRGVGGARSCPQTVCGQLRIQGREDSGVHAGLRERSMLFEPKLCRSIHGLPNGLDRLRALGNAIVPQVAYPILQAIVDMETA